MSYMHHLNRTNIPTYARVVIIIKYLERPYRRQEEYEQPVIELPLPELEEKKKKKEEIYKKKEFPLVPDIYDGVDITDKFDINKENTFQM